MKRILRSRIFFMALGLAGGFFVGAFWMVRRDFELDRALHYGTAADVREALRNGSNPNKIVVTPNFESAARKVFGFGPVGKSLPLVVAARRGDVAIVRVLLEGGANPDGHDGTGWTPLAEAAHHKNTQVCRILLEGGANPNPRFKDGTPLFDSVDAQTRAMLLGVKPKATLTGSP